jgi:hypothetical protein
MMYSRRRFARPAVDFAKARWYVTTDLILKTCSAVGIVILGSIGWTFQRNVERHREEVEAHDRVERRFLPMLEGLSELQLTCLSIVDRERRSQDRKFEKRRDPALTTDLVSLGIRLRYIADSMVFVGPEPRARLTLAHAFDDESFRGQHVRLVSVPLRPATLMFAELLENIGERDSSIEEMTIEFSPEEQTMVINAGTDIVIRIMPTLDRRSNEAWKAWLSAAPVPLRRIDLTLLAKELSVACSEQLEKTLRDHGDLADRYIGIRGEVLRHTLPRPDA